MISLYIFFLNPISHVLSKMFNLFSFIVIIYGDLNEYHIVRDVKRINFDGDILFNYWLTQLLFSRCLCIYKS